MKSPSLQSTNNAKLFVVNPEQRPINPNHVKFLISSMGKHGFMGSKPIQCYRRADGKLVVIDGHHRLEAAKHLGITFYYVVEGEQMQEAMPDGNRGLMWKNADFVRQYSIRGNKDYAALSSYVARGLPLAIAASLLGGQSAGSGNIVKSIPSGTFKVKTTDHAEKILSMIEDDPSARVFRHANFIKALSMCLWVKEFDFQTFKHRAEHNHHMIPNCSNVLDFLAAIEEVYNFRSQKRVSVAFLARETAKKRSAVKGK